MKGDTLNTHAQERDQMHYNTADKDDAQRDSLRGLPAIWPPLENWDKWIESPWLLGVQPWTV